MRLNADTRTPGGAKALRKQGKLPAVVYNRELNLSVSVDTQAFDKIFRDQGTSSIIDLVVDGETHPVLVKQVQMDKRRREPLHVDFFAITAGQLVEIYIPIEYVGTSAGAKEGGQPDIKRRELHISILPNLIPQNLEVDVSELGIGQSLHISDVAALLPEEAQILDDQELTLLTIVPPRVMIEETEEELLEEAAEPEVIGKGAEEAAEGAAEES